MGFIENIFENFNFEQPPKEPIFRAVLFGENAGYFENVSGIKSFTDTDIEIYLKKGGVIIRGEGLFVKKFCAGDLVVCGKITALERT